MTRELGQDTFDLIVDDGLHSVEANMNTLLFAMKAVKPAGWVVIEDIPARALDLWRIIGRLLLPAGHACRLVKCKRNYLFVARPGTANILE